MALKSAYLKPGNVAQVRLDGKEVKAVPSSPPFSLKINAPVLYKLRGDIPAGTMKMPQFSLSVKAPVELHIDEATNPELYTVTEGKPHRDHLFHIISITCKANFPHFGSLLDVNLESLESHNVVCVCLGGGE